MQKLNITLALGALALATSAMAKNPDVLDTVMVNSAAPERSSLVSRDTFREIGGTYSLSDGKTLSVSRRHNRLYAEIGDSQKMELIAVGNNRYVTEGADMEFTFASKSDRKPADVKVSFPIAVK